MSRGTVEKTFCRLEPYAATLIDFRSELTSLEKRWENLSAMPRAIRATDEKISALEAPQWRNYRALLLSWEFKETDRGALLDKAQQRRDELALRYELERPLFESSVREVRQRFREHVTDFAREWASAQVTPLNYYLGFKADMQFMWPHILMLTLGVAVWTRTNTGFRKYTFCAKNNLWREPFIELEGKQLFGSRGRPRP